MDSAAALLGVRLHQRGQVGLAGRVSPVPAEQVQVPDNPRVADMGAHAVKSARITERHHIGSLVAQSILDTPGALA